MKACAQESVRLRKHTLKRKRAPKKARAEESVRSSKRALEEACAQESVRLRSALKKECVRKLTSLTVSCLCKSSIMDSSRAEVLILRCLTRLLMFSSIKDEGSGGGGPEGPSG